jgi:hypothetical protein
MTRNAKKKLKIGTVSLLAMAGWQVGSAATALAQVPPPAVLVPAPPPAAETPAAPTAMTTPALAGPLVANPNPFHLPIAPFLGEVYVTGAASGIGLAQTDPVLGIDHRFNPDISNMQASLQTTEGLFQFFVQPGIYSLPTLGLPYKNVTDMPTSTKLFSGLPVAWGKLAVNDSFSIQGGKLPTLIGAEYMFTFQNMNIERGLLWAQENVINKGVQANLTTGPVAWSLSFNDGFYSDQYNYLTGSATWTINPANSFVFSGGGPVSRVTTLTGASLPQYNNSTIVAASYTYNDAPWTITPYVQYTHVGADAGLGILGSASTIGGAILANYKFTDMYNLAGRWEYIDSSGTGMGAGLLGYGPKSAAMSFTLTPTVQFEKFFVRGEASVVQLYSTAAGLAFGSGNSRTQGRFLVETGIIF